MVLVVYGSAGLWSWQEAVDCRRVYKNGLRGENLKVSLRSTAIPLAVVVALF